MLNQLVGRYRITRLIGQGGMGAVYEAQDPLIGRRVAIKTINLASAEDPEGVRERLTREARLTALLQHPNIVAVYDFGEVGDLTFIVMEFLDGRTLQRYLDDTPANDWVNFLPALPPCAEALDYAHRSGVVHLDIKPDNIMMLDGRTPKILDFGLARLSFHSRRTQSGSLAGTVLYLSPESISGQPTGPASDQFSLAVIVYRLLTGRFPFEGKSVQETFYRTLNQPPTPPDSINPQISQVAARALERALSKDPDARFSSCVEFLNEVVPKVGIGKPAATAKFGVDEFTTLFQTPAPAPSKPVPYPSYAPTAKRAPSAIRGALAAFTKLFSRTVAAPVDTRDSGAITYPETVSVEPAPLPRFEPGANSPGEQTMLLRLPRDARLSPGELATRQVEELIRLGSLHSFADVLTLEGKWLPGVEGAEPPLLAFREAARYLLAARNATNFTALEHLTRAEAVLVAAGNQILKSQTALAMKLPKALEVWKQIVRTESLRARERAASQLPNPFRAGQPLRPDNGRALFRGRDRVVGQIQSILMEANQSGSIALLGPRRCGKTSLLQMLPTLVPDCVCVFFDLQDNPVESPQAFFEALYRQAREQAKRDRQMNLPELKAPGTFSSAMEWIQALDNMEHDLRILLCLDEFERLEDLFPGDHQDLLRLMSLFRATIQHRRKVRLLVSGVAPFDELGQIWNDHFINVRQIRVGHLDRPTAEDLLIHPVSDFPEEAIPEAVAGRIYDRTGGQPYLLQLYGSLLIERLNAEGRRNATIEDVKPVEEEAMSQGAYYFRHSYESAPLQARKALEELARGGKPIVDTALSRWLAHRGLMDNKGDLAIPVLGSFMREELGLS